MSEPLLRVSFVADSDAWGGAEVYLTHLLRRDADAGWRASLVVAEPVADRFRALLPPERLRVVPLARHAAGAPATEVALRAQAPDVVHVNLVDPASNAAAVRAGLAVATTTATLHLGGDTGAGEDRAHLAALYAQLALLVTPAQEAADQVLTELTGPTGFTGPNQLTGPAGGVHVVGNGVDVPPDPHGPAGAVPVRVGAHGRLTGQKGYDVLLGVVRDLVADGHAVQVLLGGAGRDEAALREAARGLPVTFRGFVDDVRAFLAELDVFVLPSRRETMPLALMEAMAEGLPVVASDVGAVRVAVGDAGLVVPPEDPAQLRTALASLVGDPGLRAELGARARARALAHLDAATTSRRTYALLRSCVPR